MKPEMARRNFLQGICSAGILVALGSLTAAAKFPESLLRPPGGQDKRSSLCA